MGRKRKFCGNRFTGPLKKAKVVEPASRSAKKLEEVTYDIERPSGIHGFRLVDVDVLGKFLSEQLVCVHCHGKMILTEKEEKRAGWASCLQLTCQKCGTKKETMTSKRMAKNGNVFEVSRRGTLAMKAIGCGHDAMERFGSVMNIPRCLSKTSFVGQVNALRQSAFAEAENSMVAAVDEILPYYQPAEDGVVDIAVRGDGSWRKRGYSSYHGVTTLISIISGKVIDVEVKSCFCQACSYWETRKGSEEYKT